MTNEAQRIKKPARQGLQHLLRPDFLFDFNARN
jgi:hypothetical protein